MLGAYNLSGSGATSTYSWAGFNNQAITPALLGSASYTGFGTSANFSANAQVPINASNANATTTPHRPEILAATTLTNVDTEAVPFSFSSTPGTGAPGAFTMEAIVKLSFDPTNTTYRINTSTGGNYPMDILMGEGDANGARNFQFRLDQIGAGTATTTATKNPDGSSQTAGTTIPRIEFANLYGITGNQSISCNIPTTGPNAIDQGDWFHVAVVYNGLENTANNLSYYWTKMDPSNTVCNLIGTAQMTKDLLVANTSFSIGDESRDIGSGDGEGESFVGQIDEARISDNARGADQMMFTVPEPATCLMALIGIFGMGLIWLRKSR